jgi:hypothetical protein
MARGSGDHQSDFEEIVIVIQYGACAVVLINPCLDAHSVVRDSLLNGGTGQKMIPVQMNQRRRGHETHFMLSKTRKNQGYSQARSLFLKTLETPRPVSPVRRFSASLAV